MSHKRRDSTEYCAVHCSATPPDVDIGADTINQWHKDRGWSEIGYNFVIRRNGLVEVGRPMDAQGAHVLGYNDVAIGVCLVGGVDSKGKADNNFTTQQFESLLLTLKFIRCYAPDAFIQGHRDFPGVKKDCPSFSVREWLQFADPSLL